MSREVDLALRKQRLQIKSAALRGDLARDLAGIAPVFKVVDRVRAGIAWSRSHPQWIAGIVMVLAAVKPKVCWRWARRGFFAWQTWRQLRIKGEH